MKYPEGIPKVHAENFVKMLDKAKIRIKTQGLCENLAYENNVNVLKLFNLSPENYEAWARFIARKLGV